MAEVGELSQYGNFSSERIFHINLASLLVNLSTAGGFDYDRETASPEEAQRMDRFTTEFARIANSKLRENAAAQAGSESNGMQWKEMQTPHVESEEGSVPKTPAMSTRDTKTETSPPTTTTSVPKKSKIVRQPSLPHVAVEDQPISAASSEELKTPATTVKPAKRLPLTPISSNVPRTQTNAASSSKARPSKLGDLATPIEISDGEDEKRKPAPSTAASRGKTAASSSKAAQKRRNSRSPSPIAGPVLRQRKKVNTFIEDHEQHERVEAEIRMYDRKVMLEQEAYSEEDEESEDDEMEDDSDESEYDKDNDPTTFSDRMRMTRWSMRATTSLVVRWVTMKMIAFTMEATKIRAMARLSRGTTEKLQTTQKRSQRLTPTYSESSKSTMTQPSSMLTRSLLPHTHEIPTADQPVHDLTKIPCEVYKSIYDILFRRGDAELGKGSTREAIPLLDKCRPKTCGGGWRPCLQSI